MIFFGSRDSSPYIAVDSKPTQDQKAKKRPRPAEVPLKALTGLTGPKVKPSGPPPCSATEIAMAARTVTSVASSTTSSFSATETPNQVPAALTASMTIAKVHHGMSRPVWSLSVVVAKVEKMPMSAGSKTTYAKVASSPEARPTVRPRP